MSRNMSKGQNMAFYLFLGISSLWTVVPLAAGGSQESSNPSRSVAAEGAAAVKIFDVSPPVRMPAILPLEESVPKPLDAEARARIISAIRGEGAADVELAPQSITLTAKNPRAAEQANLVMTLPYRFHPESAIEFHGDYPHVVGLSLKVEKGGLYLVDFAVKGVGQGAYTLESGSDSQVFEDPSGYLQHVLFGVRAAESGWTSLRMRRSGAGYKLYSVEITRIE
jgi:hypothetical protein